MIYFFFVQDLNGWIDWILHEMSDVDKLLVKLSSLHGIKIIVYKKKKIIFHHLLTLLLCVVIFSSVFH